MRPRAVTFTQAVRHEIRAIPRGIIFTQRDVEKITDDMRKWYPNVPHIDASVRCTLQRMRDDEGLQFVDDHGRYRWPKHGKKGFFV